jgi:hypothetical protein
MAESEIYQDTPLGLGYSGGEDIPEYIAQFNRDTGANLRYFPVSQIADSRSFFRDRGFGPDTVGTIPNAITGIPEPHQFAQVNATIERSMRGALSTAQSPGRLHRMLLGAGGYVPPARDVMDQAFKRTPYIKRPEARKFRAGEERLGVIPQSDGLYPSVEVSLGSQAEQAQARIDAARRPPEGYSSIGDGSPDDPLPPLPGQGPPLPAPPAPQQYDFLGSIQREAGVDGIPNGALSMVRGLLDLGPSSGRRPEYVPLNPAKVADYTRIQGQAVPATPGGSRTYFEIPESGLDISFEAMDRPSTREQFQQRTAARSRRQGEADYSYLRGLPLSQRADTDPRQIGLERANNPLRLAGVSPEFFEIVRRGLQDVAAFDIDDFIRDNLTPR